MVIKAIKLNMGEKTLEVLDMPVQVSVTFTHSTYRKL